MLPCLESLDSRLLDLAPGAGGGTDSRRGGMAEGVGVLGVLDGGGYGAPG